MSEVYTGEGLVTIKNPGNSKIEIEISGNEKQETREGKNLYNVYDTEGRNFNSTLLKIDDEDKISLEDYTNSSDTTKWIDFNTNISQKIKASTVYYVVTEIFSVSGSGNLTVVSTNATAPGQFATSVSYNFSALAAGDVKIAQITSRKDLSNCVSMLRSFLQFTSGQSGSIEFRVSVLENSVTAEDFVYEKFGESPSFDYPSEVNAVGQDVNLFNNIKTINGGVDNNTSKIVASTANRLFVCECEPKETYTVSKNIKTDIARFRIDCSDELPDIGSVVTKLIYDNTRLQATVTTTSNAKYLILTMCDVGSHESVQIDDVLNNIKVQKGDFATPQTPYRARLYRAKSC